MFLGYRFNRYGRYYPADYFDRLEKVYAYIKENKTHYPEIRITDKTGSDLLIHVLDGRIVFPKQWALMEIQDDYLISSHIFNADEFTRAMHRAGFTEFIPPQTRIEADGILKNCYESLSESSSV